MKDLFGHDKTEKAIEHLKMFEPPEGYYGATSWGKDSLTIMTLVDMARLKKPVEWHYHITTIDPPELIYFARSLKRKDVVWDRPEKPFLIKMVEIGFPTRLNRWCCKEYKECGGSGRRVLTGIRQEESLKRSKRKMVEPCLKDESKTFINPIIDWKRQDIWSFIREYQVPYCKLYDEGFKRIGCILCPQNYNRKMEAQRWPRMVVAFQKAFIKLYEDRKSRGLSSVDNWRDGLEMFNWWLSNKGKDNPDQTVMFE